MYSKRKTMQYKNISGYANTRQHLNDSTLSPTGAFPQAFAHKPKSKRNTGKESRLPCSASTLSSTALRLSCLSCLASTCLSCHVRSSTRVPLKPRPLLKPRALRRHISQHTLRLHTLAVERFSTTRALTALSLSHSLPPSQSTLDQYSDSLLFRRAPLSTSSLMCASPSSGRVRSVSANRERTRCPSPGLPSLRNQAD